MSTATQATGAAMAAALRDFLVMAIDVEYPTTKKVIEAIQPGDWRPDPKSKTAMELAWHIVTSELWFLNAIADLKFGEGKPPECPATPQEIVAFYEDRYTKLMDRVRAMTGDQLQQIIDFYGMKFPAYAYLQFTIKHSVHHRGQLSTYLRPLGGKCPSIYGGSADEPFKG